LRWDGSYGLVELHAGLGIRDYTGKTTRRKKIHGRQGSNFVYTHFTIAVWDGGDGNSEIEQKNFGDKRVERNSKM